MMTVTASAYRYDSNYNHVVNFPWHCKPDWGYANKGYAATTAGTAYIVHVLRADKNA